jgi:hypothetical protein
MSCECCDQETAMVRAMKLSPCRRNMTEQLSRRAGATLGTSFPTPTLEVRKLISSTGRSIQRSTHIRLLVSCSIHLLLVAYSSNTQQRSCRPKPPPSTPATPPSRYKLSPNTVALLSMLMDNRTRRSPRLCALPTLLLPEVSYTTQLFRNSILTMSSRRRCHPYRKLAAQTITLEPH